MNTVEMILSLTTTNTTETADFGSEVHRSKPVDHAALIRHRDFWTDTRQFNPDYNGVVNNYFNSVYHAELIPVQDQGYAAYWQQRGNERTTEVMDHLKLARGTAGKFGLRKSENFGGLPWPTKEQLAAWKARGIYCFSAHQRGGFLKARRCAESVARSKGYAVLVRSQQYSAWVVAPQIDSHAEGIWGWCHASEVSLPRSPGFYWVRAPKPVPEPLDTWEVTYTDPATSCTVSKLMRHHDPVMLATIVRSELPNVRNLDVTYLDRDVLDETAEVHGGSDEDGEDLDPIENIADPIETLGSSVEWNAYLMRMFNDVEADWSFFNPDFNDNLLWHPSTRN
jgi:hypothetical protein